VLVDLGKLFIFVKQTMDLKHEENTKMYQS